MLITFQKDLQPLILQAFGKTKDKQGFIVDKKTRERVITPDGEHLQATDFAGLTKGSVVYLKSDIVSLITYVEKKHGSYR